MKKLLTVTLVMMMVLGLMGGVVMAAEDECPAAPAVASKILQDFDIDFRYEDGNVEHPRHGIRILYSNYIAMVAGQMTNEAAFPVYACDGTWDENDDYVDKCDQEAYYWAVYNYLRSLGADLDCPFCGVVDPAASGAAFKDNKDRTGTMYLTVIDKCGNGIEGLELADIEADIQWVGLTDLNTLGAGGYWNIDLDDEGDGDYEITFHRLGSVTYTRTWGIIVDGVDIGDVDVKVSLEAVLQSVVYEGTGNIFGSDIGDKLTFIFSTGIFHDSTKEVTFETTERLWEGWGDPPMSWEISGNLLIVTATSEFMRPRDVVGDKVIDITGLVDAVGKGVVVPGDGVEVTQQ